MSFQAVEHELSDGQLERMLCWIKEALPSLCNEEVYSPITFRVEKIDEQGRHSRIVFQVPEGAEEQLCAMPVFACGGSFELRCLSTGSLEVQVDQFHEIALSRAHGVGFCRSNHQDRSIWPTKSWQG